MQNIYKYWVLNPFRSWDACHWNISPVPQDILAHFERTAQEVSKTLIWAVLTAQHLPPLLVLGCMCHQLWPPAATAVTGQLQLPHHCRCPTSVVDRCKCDYKCIFEPFQCNPIASCQSFVQEEESCHRPKQLFSFQLSASHNIKIRS